MQEARPDPDLFDLFFQRMRKRIEELFGEAKEFMGLRRAKFRRMKFVKEQVLMTAAAQNIKRIVKLLSGKGSKAPAMAVQKPLSLSFVKGLLKILAWLPLEFGRNLDFGEKCPVET